MSRAHSFNAVHGRMPAVATGALLANRTLIGARYLRRRGHRLHRHRASSSTWFAATCPLVYVIEDNGVYGLTKGQFSATADRGSKLKTGVVNELPAIDTCLLAIQLGATFVGR